MFSKWKQFKKVEIINAALAVGAVLLIGYLFSEMFKRN